MGEALRCSGHGGRRWCGGEEWCRRDSDGDRVGEGGENERGNDRELLSEVEGKGSKGRGEFTSAHRRRRRRWWRKLALFASAGDERGGGLGFEGAGDAIDAEFGAFYRLWSGGGSREVVRWTGGRGRRWEVRWRWGCAPVLMARLGGLARLQGEGGRRSQQG